MPDYEVIRRQAELAATELLAQARLAPGDIFVVGCSSSEVTGQRIGQCASMEAAQAVWNGISPVLAAHKIFLAAQCCEHLNRALVIEAGALGPRDEIVSVVPQPKAGGSFASTAYAHMRRPVVIENVRAGAGIDIGGTLIGMHLRPVAVPVRLSIAQIGSAPILCARTRPKYIGGARAVYAPES